MSRRAQSDKVLLVGLDVGSTTSSLLAIEARIANNCATGRMEFRDGQAIHRPAPAFTAFSGPDIDLEALRERVSSWLADARIDRADIFAGGAIVTGLAAERDNADAVAGLVSELLGDSVVATADDPRLEAWLAFMGGAAALSRAHRQRPMLNLDIGGGTTNPGYGVDGNVRATGCYFVGARHFEFETGSYRLRNVSRHGALILQHLGLELPIGSELEPGDRRRLLQYFVDSLAAIVAGDRGFFDNAAGRAIEQSPYTPAGRDPVLTYSGGVGELIYAIAAGEPVPDTTHFGDLGIDLALAILEDERLARDVADFVPEHRGRATVQGLTLNSTEISGTTLFLLGDDTLPLRDLPVVASVSASSAPSALLDALNLAGRSQRGACLQLVWNGAHPSFEDVKQLGGALSHALDTADLPSDASLVILTNANVGKALGNYATAWRSTARRLIVIDEIPERNALFVNLGRMRNGVVPVSFYGMN